MPHVVGKCCLDAGCGLGFATRHLAQYGAGKIVGIDVSEDAIAYANRYCSAENIEFKQMDACDLEFADDCFDVVFSFDVLEHIHRDKQKVFMSEVARVLQTDGIAVIGSPNASFTQTRIATHQHELTFAEFETLLKTHFKNVAFFGQFIVLDGERRALPRDKYVPKRPFRYADSIISAEGPEQAPYMIGIGYPPLRQTGP